MAFTDPEAEEMLEACEGAEGLTQWEQEFLASLREVADADEERGLTAAQEKKLKQIYEERCT